MDKFSDFIKFGISFPKDKVKFPKSWQNLKKSKYNNEPNFALLTGKINNIIVIDLDIKGSDKSTSWFETGFCKIQDIDTLTTKSVNGGYHVFYKYTENVKSKSFKEFNVDILSDRRCCFGGVGYPVIKDLDIIELTPAQINYINCINLNLNDNIGTNLNQDKLKIDVNALEIQLDKHKNKSDLSQDDLWLIIDGLSSTRFDNRDHWLKVGYILKNYPFGQDLFLKFSKKSLLYNQDRHDLDWKSISDGKSKVSIGTLIYWLKADNPELYNKIYTKIYNKLNNHNNKHQINEIQHNEKILNELDILAKNINYNINHIELVKHNKTSIEAIFNNLDNVLVNIHNLNSPECPCMRLYTDCIRSGYKFKCYNCSFEFPDNVIPMNKEVAPTIFNNLIINEDISNRETLKVALRIVNEVRIIFNNKRWFVYDNKSGIYVKRDRLEIIKIVDDVVNNLRDIGENNDWFSWTDKIAYKKSLLEELEVQCFTKNTLDDNPHLLGFSNGVYDLYTGEFRRGHIDEFVSMICKYPYADYSTDLAEQFLRDIFPNNEEYIYALSKFSLILEGGNREQTITFNYGFTASNGKSFLMERINDLLGDYANTFQVNLITSKMKAAGEANSTLIDFKNKRFMYCSEPESKAKLNTNFVKMLTGDVIKARGLYSNEDECIKPTYDIFVCCNALPAFDTYDEGITRRIKLLEYKTKFCENPKKKNEKQVKRYSSQEIIDIERGLLFMFIKTYTNLRLNNYKYNEPLHLVNLKNLYINDSKTEITNILCEKFETGSKSDFVKMKDVRDVLKYNNIEKDSVSIKYIFQDIFDNCEFFDKKQINNKEIRSIFIGVKIIL